MFDNRDGIPYTSQTGQMEDYPDDGYDRPAICQDYTTETDGDTWAVYPQAVSASSKVCGSSWRALPDGMARFQI